MRQTLKANELPIGSILGDAFAFAIPPYQRPYAWTTDQVGELLDDLRYAAGREGDAIDSLAPYFLGSIVLIKKQESPEAEVVDGQQRLTTLTILLVVLRELAEGKDAERLNRYVLEQADPISGTKERYRLLLRDRDRSFFSDHVQKEGRLAGFIARDADQLGSDMRRRIQENARFLRDHLAPLSQGERNRLTAFLIQRCYLVVVSASDQASAYRIFAVMNDRGLDLSPTDILKAEIIGGLPETDERLRETYTAKWEALEEDLGREDFRDLFGHIRTLYAKEKARGALNKEFRDVVLKGENADGAVFVDRVLEPLADAYAIVTRAAYRTEGNATAVNRYLEHLNRLDNADWVPPAMLFFRKHTNEHELLVRFARDLERLAYVLFVVRADVNERIRRFADVARTIEAGDDLWGEGSPLLLSEAERARALSAIDGPVYETTRLRMPLVLRLDGLLTDDGARYDHAVLSLEHVLPQNPKGDSEWVDAFPDEEERVGWTHRLANLVLLSRRKNSQAGNYDFERKKVEYFQRRGAAPFVITTQVLGEDKWTPAVLERRQRDLVGALAAEWRLDRA